MSACIWTFKCCGRRCKCKSLSCPSCCVAAETTSRSRRGGDPKGSSSTRRANLRVPHLDAKVAEQGRAEGCGESQPSSKASRIQMTEPGIRRNVGREASQSRWSLQQTLNIPSCSKSAQEQEHPVTVTCWAVIGEYPARLHP
jgi:hypothetical protein